MAGLEGMDLHSPLHRSTLLRLLQEWAQVDGEPSRQDVAERLSPWLGAFDAVKLDGALQQIESYAAQTRVRGQAVDAHALDAAFLALKTEVADMVTASLFPPGEPVHDAKADYGPSHQRYLGLQKRMELAVDKLRQQVRQTLSRGSAPLRQLAALDTVMAQMLGPREQKLLGTVPVYLERRFEHRRECHRQQLAASGLSDDPGQWRLAGGWLHAFQHDLREMLLAELQVRLQPILGLIEAVHTENREQA